MEPIKIVLAIIIPVFGLSTFFLFRHYNSGYDTLASKSWAIKTALLTFILFLASIILYFLIPLKGNHQTENQAITRIEEVKKLINDLNNYVDKQKDSLQEANTRLKQLQSTHNQLQPIVNAERETVDSLLDFNESRHRKEKWMDTIISSIIGAILTLMITNFFSSKRGI